MSIISIWIFTKINHYRKYIKAQLSLLKHFFAPFSSCQLPFITKGVQLRQSSDLCCTVKHELLGAAHFIHSPSDMSYRSSAVNYGLVSQILKKRIWILFFLFIWRFSSHPRQHCSSFETRQLWFKRDVRCMFKILIYSSVSKTNVLFIDCSCWLSMEDGTVWAFIGPVIAVITVCANA